MRAISYVRYCIFTIMMALMLCIPASSAAQVVVGVAVGFAPPDLPIYEQPICPGEGYIWTPGYWAYDYDFGDYYWVPGTWVLAPEVGFLWTPGYWAWGGSGFVFYEGFWGPVVGFYGGINYGYGYFGHGYEGGRWDGGRFYYNRSVNNVNVTVIHNVYNTTVINNSNVTRVSYNGGNGGISERPRPEEEAAAHARHLAPVSEQRQHWQAARSNPEQRASMNHGKPPIAATPKPGAFNEHGVMSAREGGAVHNAPRGNNGNNVPNPRGNNGNNGNNVPRPPAAVHPKDLPPMQRPSPMNSGNPKLDQKYQQQQEKLYAQQERDRQKLQQQQEKEHQQLARQNADEARRQQVEQRHQQQTEQLQQRHSEQQQRMQQRQPEARPAPPKEKEKH